MQKCAESAGTRFVRRVGLHGCIWPEIRDASAEGYRLHFGYRLPGVTRVNMEYAKSQDLEGREKVLWRELVAHLRWEDRDWRRSRSPAGLPVGACSGCCPFAVAAWVATTKCLSWKALHKCAGLSM